MFDLALDNLHVLPEMLRCRRGWRQLRSTVQGCGVSPLTLAHEVSHQIPFRFEGLTVGCCWASLQFPEGLSLLLDCFLYRRSHKRAFMLDIFDYLGRDELVHDGKTRGLSRRPSGISVRSLVHS